MIKLLVIKTAIIRQIKILYLFMLNFSLNTSFGQENKNSLTKEYINNQIDIISQYYKAYNIFGNNNDKALEVLVKDLQTQHTDISIIELINLNLIKYKKISLKKYLIQEEILVVMIQVMYNSKLVSELLKDPLKF